MNQKNTMSSDDWLPNEKQVKQFAMLSPMLHSLLNEMREFSKKKQDGIVNATKIKMINRILSQVKEILASEPSIEYLDLLDEEVLPENGDAVLILGQYDAAMAQFREKYYGQEENTFDYRWFTQENPGSKRK